MSRGPQWWDRWFLGLAEYAATASKDPSTQVGAVIVRPNRTVASFGFNGFPRGVVDSPERLNDRAQKYPRVVHAELNSILSCAERPYGYTLYVYPMAPCCSCAAAIIQAGIARVVATKPDEGTESRWAESMEVSMEMFREAEVVFEVVG